MASTARYDTRARAAADAKDISTTNKSALPLPKRALGDITNFAHDNSHQPHPAKQSYATKIRRTGTTKPSSASSAAARRAKSTLLAAAAKKPSPMSSSIARAPRRQSGRLAKRAAEAVAAACKLEFAPVSEHDVPDLPDPLARFPIPPGILDIDSADDGDHFAVPDFAAEIYSNFVKRETNFMPDAAYMSRQQDITIKMRAILVDWLVDVHQKFKLQPETLHLTINIIDRFLAVTPVMRRKLQLVGVTAMLIASKYEEVYAPEVSDFVYISDKAYSKEEIISMEAVILNTLQYDVTVPSGLTFMSRCLKAIRADIGYDCLALRHIVHYCVELSLQDSRMLRFRPSMRAAAACRVAARWCSLPLIWNAGMVYHSGGWKEEELAECEVELIRILEHERDESCTNKLTAIKRKFSSTKFACISSKISKTETQPTGMDICTSE